MGRVVAGMTMSVDGFVADAKGGAGALYVDLEALRPTAYMQKLIAETGAVLMGRTTFDMAEDPDAYVGNYEFHVPIFVVTHEPPVRVPLQDERLTFTFVTDGVESAVAQATAAAGDLAVTVVGGADLSRQLLAHGLVDELRIDVMPVLMGMGQRFFDDASLEHLRLRKLDVTEVGARTSLRFAVTAG